MRVPNRGFVIVWLLLGLALVVTLLLGNQTGFVAGGMVWLAAGLLAFCTILATDHRGSPTNAILYRVTLATSLVIPAVGLVGASRWHFFTSTGEQGGRFALLATAFAIVGVLAWRALVKPTPRRAAFAGFAAIVLPVLAAIQDIRMAGDRAESSRFAGSWPKLAVIMTGLGVLVGILTCAAALGLFGHRQAADELPEARLR